ncbi:MAG: PAS domain-containing protein [Nitrospirae bacterium]|nr:PAS domain-containing protein [Nitrospirota bacterium]
MMSLCDVNGTIIIASKAFKEYFGDDIEGKIIYDVVCKRFHCEDKCIIKDTLKTGVAKERVLSNKGLVIAIKVYPLFDNEGSVNGCIWIGRDITREKEYEERALQSEKLIALGELVAGIAHEINNPLSVIVGYSEIMLQNNQLSESDRKRLEKIFQSGTRAANIITNLLEFARRKAPEQAPCNLNVIADKIIDLIHYELKSDGIRLIRSYAANLPSVMGDPTQLGQVILNILKNAHDALADQDKPGEIEIKTYYDEKSVYVDITDNGPGIPEENLKRIFEPFFTTKDIGKGTGLGLSITYSIIKAHGGDIIIKNRPEGGIIVHITLPRGNISS